MENCIFHNLNLLHVSFSFFSQAVGEPPLFLASSVFFAIKDAIRYFRKDNGCLATFELWAPATVERIRMACQDQFTEMVGLPSFMYM